MTSRFFKHLCQSLPHRFTAHLFTLVSEGEGCGEEYLGAFLVFLLFCLGSFLGEEAVKSQETTYFFAGRKMKAGTGGPAARSLQDHIGASS